MKRDILEKPLTTDHMRKVIWKAALETAGIEYRPMMRAYESALSGGKKLI